MGGEGGGDRAAIAGRARAHGPWRELPLGEHRDGRPFDTLVKGWALMRSLGLRPWLASGTLLGVVRDNCFIPWDTDIDVDTRGEGVDPDRVIKRFIAEGFRLIRTTESKLGMTQLAFIDEHEVIFDIQLWYRDGDDLLCPTDLGLMVDPARFFVDLYPWPWRGRRWLVPSPVTEYLAHRFREWKTPTRSKGPWQADAGNLA